MINLPPAKQVVPPLQVGSMLMYGTSSDLFMRGDDVSFDPDAIPPSSDDYLNEHQRTTKAIAILESKFGDRFVIKHGSGNSEQFCQFRGGGGIFIFNRTQPLGAVILTEESNSDDLEVGDTHELKCGAVLFLSEKRLKQN